MCWAAPLPPLYIGGEGGAAPHLGFPPQGWRQPPDAIWVAARRGERGGAPGVGLRAHLLLGFAPSPLEGALGLGGRRPSPPRGWSLPTIGPRRPLGLVAPPGGPPDPSGGPGTLPVMPRTLPVAKSSLPIYQSLPPDHYGTPRDVWDLIRDSEQHSVTAYILPL